MSNNLKDLKERSIIIGEESNSFNKLHFVKAGAGAGKTTSIKDRVLKLIKTKNLLPERLVLITYTTKAANELVTKIRDVIEQELQNNNNTAAEHERLKFALATLAYGKISTFHSFCYDLLREYPVEFKVDPDAEIGDERAQETIYLKCFEKLCEMAETATGWEGIESLKDLSSLREHNSNEKILGMLVQLYSNRDLKALPVTQDLYKTEEIHANFRKNIEDIVGTFSQITDNLMVDEDKMVTQYLNTIAPMLQRFRNKNGYDFDLMTDYLLSNTDFLIKQKGKAPNFKKDYLKNLKIEIKALNDLFGKFQKTTGVTSYNQVVAIFNHFEKVVEQYKKDHCLLDFFDCLYKVTGGLKNNPELLRIVQKRFDVIIVDEFQDSDPMQADIAFLLGSDDLTKLFFVGDPKQCIYGFARADIAVYQGVMDKVNLLPEGSLLSLTTNFRSYPEVLKFINFNFKSILVRDSIFRDITVDYEAMDLDPKKVTEKSEVARWKMEVGLATDEDGINADEKRTREAFMVAVEISELVKAKKYDYKDFLILFRTGTAMTAYEEALNLLKIPVVNTKSKDFLKKSEVLDLLNVLAYVALPNDKYYKKCAFNSPLLKNIEASDIELILNSSCNIVTRFNQLLNQIGIVECGLQENSDVFIQLAVNLISLFEVELTITNYNVFESLSNLSVKAMSDSFLSSIKLNDEKIYIESKKADVVRLMTIHSAKGLESRVVIISALGSMKNMGRNNYINRKDQTFYPTNSFINDKAVDDLQLSSVTEMNRIQDKKEEEEEKRVMYVAATRAIEHLIVLDEEFQNSFLGILINGNNQFTVEKVLNFKDYLNSYLEFDNFSNKKMLTLAPVNASEDFRELYDERDISQPVTALIEDDEVFKNNQGRKNGMAFGILTHQVFESLSLTLFHHKTFQIETDKVVEHFRKLSKEIFESGDLDLLKLKAHNFLNSDLARQIVAAEIVQTEIPFELKANYHGIIDLLIVDRAGVKVVDFKSDQLKVKGPAIKEHYKKQIRLYTEALAKIVGKSVEGECYYIFEELAA